MGRLFWIFMALLGFLLIALITTHDQNTIMGFENDVFGSAVSLSLWGALIAAGILGSGMRFGDIARQLVVWIIIILTLMVAYLFRYDVQDIASRITGGLVPGSPISSVGDNGRQQVTLIRSNSGHFEVSASINGKPVRFLVDTGASSVVLSYEDAINIGINPNRLSFTIPVSTANGRAMAATARIDVMAIGSISRSNKSVLVAAKGALNGNLLGMSFLGTLSSYEVRGDRMILRD